MDKRLAPFGDRLAPDGTPVAENFARWFGRSTIVDGSGAPLVVFHGTAADFDSFDPACRGEKTGGADARQAHFFAENPMSADQFTWKAGDKCGSIMPVYLRLEYPFASDLVLTGANGTAAGEVLARARREGYDGVVFLDSDMLGHRGATFAVFDASQVKSAIGNSGLFSRDSNGLADQPLPYLGEKSAALRMEYAEEADSDESPERERARA